MVLWCVTSVVENKQSVRLRTNDLLLYSEFNPWGKERVVWTERLVLTYTRSVCVCVCVCVCTCALSHFSSVAQSCPTLCDPMNHSMLGLPVHHQLPEFTQTHVHQVSEPIQPSHPLSSPSPLASNPSQHQGLFQWVNSLHEVAKVLEFQLQHQSFQWTPSTDLL